MFTSSKIAALEKDLETANASLATAQSQVADLQNANTALTEANTTLTGQLAEANQNLTNLTAERDSLQEQLNTVTGERDAAISAKADAEGKVEAEVQKRIGRVGVPAVRRVDNPSKDDPKAGGNKGESPRKRLAAIFNSKFQK